MPFFLLVLTELEKILRLLLLQWHAIVKGKRQYLPPMPRELRQKEVILLLITYQQPIPAAVADHAEKSNQVITQI
jgi:hypothetical protein